jgi:hypothetical protein
MHLKSIGFTNIVLFLSTGKAEDVLLPYFGKSDIYPKKSLGKLAANFNIYWSFFPVFQYSDKNLLPTYLNFYANKYPTYQ